MEPQVYECGTVPWECDVSAEALRWQGTPDDEASTRCPECMGPGMPVQGAPQLHPTAA